VFSRYARALPKRLQDVQAATVRLYSAASAQLTTPGHSYSGDMTRQDGTTALAMFSTTGWQATRPGVPTPLKTLFATSSHYDPRCCIGFQPPRGHLSGHGSQYNCLTLSYKRLGQAPLHRGGRKNGSGKTGLNNTTSFSRGCRVLRSSGSNHVNLRVHHVHQ
jgi:hypothetical protein